MSARRDTHRGLGEVEASFTPSDPSELTPEFSAQGADAFDFHFPSDARVPSIPDDGRPVDELGMGAAEGPDRRRFATATGGGSNRVSGGRDVARAYVAPMTPAPVHLRTPDTISIEVSDTFNQFDTIPSITRRKLAESDAEVRSLLARPARNRLRRVIWIGALAIVGGIGVGLVVRALGNDESSTDPGPKLRVALPPSSGESPATASAPSEPKAAPAVADPGLEARSAAAASPEVVPAPSAESPVSPPANEPASGSARTSEPGTTAATKPTKPARTRPGGELWLE